jgi:hypothetical protein
MDCFGCGVNTMSKKGYCRSCAKELKENQKILMKKGLKEKYVQRFSLSGTREQLANMRNYVRLSKRRYI